MGEEYSFNLEIFRTDSTPIGQVSAEPDWRPALDWTLFSAIRTGRLPPVMSRVPHFIRPIWDPKTGEPYVVRVRIVLVGEDGNGACFSDIPISYFGDAAQQASADFVSKGLLKPGELFLFKVSSFLAEPDSRSLPADLSGISVKEIVEPLILSEKNLGEMVRRSAHSGDVQNRDMPVFLPQGVLNEILALVQEANHANEIGGILIGKLYGDCGSHEIMAEVTSQVFARHACSQLNRLTFTKETWTAVKAAIDLRKEDEIMVGWWHAHLYLRASKDCEKCEGKTGPSPVFMSSQDVFFQRTVFSRPWSVALVIGDSPCKGLEFCLFGWRHGMIQPRGFHILDSQIRGEGNAAGSNNMKGREDGDQSDESHFGYGEGHR